jgi:hypothetical protein
MPRQSRNERKRNSSRKITVTIAGTAVNYYYAQVVREVTSASFTSDMPTDDLQVFHAKCYGFSKAQARKMSRILCSQHDCTVCKRTTAQCGGMLFRYVIGSLCAGRFHDSSR